MIRQIVSGYTFDGGAPALRVDRLSDGALERMYLPIMGKDVALQRLKPRHCVGYYDLLTLADAPCPAFTKLEDPRQDQCVSCFRRSGFNPAFYNVSREELSLQQRSYNDQPHEVYVAWFGQELIKVGISNRRRTLHRLLEQGALRASIVARVASAYEARAHERRIRDRLGIAESISHRAKTAVLTGWEGPPGAAPELEAALRAVDTLRLEGATPTFVENFEPWYTGGSELSLIGQGLSDLSSTRPLAISGRPLALVGPLLIVAHPQLGALACSLRQFIGHAVRFESAPLSLPEGAKQARLI